jgi:hypothetical protein
MVCNKPCNEGKVGRWSFDHDIKVNLDDNEGKAP